MTHASLSSSVTVQYICHVQSSWESLSKWTGAQSRRRAPWLSCWGLGSAAFPQTPPHSYTPMATPPRIPSLLIKQPLRSPQVPHPEIPQCPCSPILASCTALLLVMAASSAQWSCLILLGPAPYYAPICSSVLCRWEPNPLLVPNTKESQAGQREAWAGAPLHIFLDQLCNMPKSWSGKTFWIKGLQY